VRVGIVVEGHSEYKALPELSHQVQTAIPVSAFKTLRATYDPLAPPKRIVKGCRSRIDQLALRRYDVAVVLVDRETQSAPCQEIAQGLQKEFERGGFGIPIRVVVKDRSFENWLIADLEALRQMPSRFRVTQGLVTKVEPNRADRADALRLLKQAAQGGAYGKVEDSKRILEKAHIDRMARHSRSFRCFLARLGDPRFSGGSCRPPPV
jgi:hypothetical protein